MTLEFHIGDLLSVTHGKLLSPNGIGGCYEILNHMTGDTLFTHQLPRAAEAAKPALLRQHPRLAEIDASDVTPENWRDWLAVVVAAYGETLFVEPLAAGEWEHRDPITEAEEMVGPDRVIAVVGS